MKNYVRIKFKTGRPDAGLIVDRDTVLDIPDDGVECIPEFFETSEELRELMNTAVRGGSEDIKKHAVKAVYSITEEEPYLDEYIDFFLDWFNEGPEMADFYRNTIKEYHDNNEKYIFPE